MLIEAYQLASILADPWLANGAVDDAQPPPFQLPTDRGHASHPRITRHRVMLQTPPPGTLAADVNDGLQGVIPVQPHIYEITFSRQATTGPGTTTFRAGVPDQAALSGLLHRIAGPGLEIIHVLLVTAGLSLDLRPNAHD